MPHASDRWWLVEYMEILSKGHTCSCKRKQLDAIGKMHRKKVKQMRGVCCLVNEQHIIGGNIWWNGKSCIVSVQNCEPIKWAKLFNEFNAATTSYGQWTADRNCCVQWPQNLKYSQNAQDFCPALFGQSKVEPMAHRRWRSVNTELDQHILSYIPKYHAKI